MAAQDQHPINSGFGFKTTARDIVGHTDLTGRNYIVTGGGSGIGLETVRALARVGGHVTVPVRDRGKAEAALADVAGQVVIADMDLADIASVRRFAADYAANGKPLHGLINNAGFMACPLARVGKAWEYQFAVCISAISR
ncbi:MAG: L-fuco-beta-pyranose dehydrogenase [Sphingomonas bacterium]|uniref:SDR family NAD(P)-dependent oxidoreductase n=1 Tax=Sphingomonas bacterium TaxID=1895847 RepID=UPI00261871D7|nr:SDR family NAD(P)-dependent oxidoreductase [Sphingomonas bacterium]MDB5710259.1 L-fuco-beta-pyranose dehydrogenase [Sphingomonas bacterium]